MGDGSCGKWKLPHMSSQGNGSSPACSSTAIGTRRGLDCLPNGVGAPLKVETSGAALPSPCQLACSRPVTSRWPKFQGRRVHRIHCASLQPTPASFGFCLQSIHCLRFHLILPLVAYHDKCQIVNVNVNGPARYLPHSNPPKHPRAAPLHHDRIAHDYLLPITPPRRAGLYHDNPNLT